MRPLLGEKFLVVGADSHFGIRISQKLTQKKASYFVTTRSEKTLEGQRCYLDLNGDISNWIIPPNVTVAFFLAGITSLDFCRKNPEQSYKVNVINTIQLMERLINNNVFVIFPSTNQVFDGQKPAHKETDAVSPLTQYGIQKAEVEKYLLKREESGCIVRLTKIAESLLPLLIEWKNKIGQNIPVGPFSDMIFSPISLDSCIDGMISIARKKPHGIFHFSGDKDMTYAELCLLLADILGLSRDLKKQLIRPTLTRDIFPYTEAVPIHSALDTSKLIRELNITLPSSRNTINALLQKLLAGTK